MAEVSIVKKGEKWRKTLLFTFFIFCLILLFVMAARSKTEILWTFKSGEMEFSFGFVKDFYKLPIPGFSEPIKTGLTGMEVAALSIGMLLFAVGAWYERINKPKISHGGIMAENLITDGIIPVTRPVFSSNRYYVFILEKNINMICGRQITMEERRVKSINWDGEEFFLRKDEDFFMSCVKESRGTKVQIYMHPDSTFIGRNFR